MVSLGLGVVEACLVWGAPQAWWQERIRFKGTERLLNAQSGVVLLTPHMHTFEILPLAMAMLGVRPSGFHQGHEAGLDAQIRQWRQKMRSVLAIRKSGQWCGF